jgi:predicted Zn finger-like uncharacterized protein
MKMHCPHCGAKGSVDDAYIGRRIRCPRCQETFRCEADPAPSAADVSPDAAMPPISDHGRAAVAPATAPPAADSGTEGAADKDGPEPLGRVQDAEGDRQEEAGESGAIPADGLGDGSVDGSGQHTADDAVSSAVSPPDPGPDDRHQPASMQVIPPVPLVAAAIPARAGDVAGDFSLGGALTETWKYTRGAKGTIWAAVGMMYLLMLILGIGLGFLQALIALDPLTPGEIWLERGVQALISAVSTIFTAGLMYLGVRRAAARSISWKMVFAGFPLAVNLLIASILMLVLVFCGFVLLILPGIYLTVGYTMALPLMLDRGLAPWEAMEASRRAIHKVWWKVFGTFLVMGFIYLVSVIPLGIGLIWTVPMFVVLVGVIYRYLFGSRAENDRGPAGAMN